MNDIILEVSGLRIEWLSANGRGAHPPLVDGLDLSVRRGGVTGLIGESGCGKSLTCLAVMGLLPPCIRLTAGRITLAGTPLVDARREDLRRLRGRRAAMILQHPMSCFDPVFTVGDHIRESLAAHDGTHVSPQAITEALATMGFDSPEEILRAYPFQLSGGMLQRVMIALALLLEAELLIADEPTTDLDVIAQARILDLVDRLRRERGMGVLLVTHDLSVIARLADEVLVMQGGRIVERGPVARLFAAACHGTTRALLAAHFSLYGLDPASTGADPCLSSN
jgi:nickel transport system ATP-binding protein